MVSCVELLSAKLGVPAGRSTVVAPGVDPSVVTSDISDSLGSKLLPRASAPVSAFFAVTVSGWRGTAVTGLNVSRLGLRLPARRRSKVNCLMPPSFEALAYRTTAHIDAAHEP